MRLPTILCRGVAVLAIVAVTVAVGACASRTASNDGCTSTEQGDDD
jgi:hypothetical protein